MQEYKGLQITLEKRLRDRWQLYGSYTFSAAEGNKGTHHRTSQVSVYSNPNNLMIAFGKTTLNRNHSFKFAGSYLGPYDIWLSASYFAQTGIPLQRDRGVLGPLVRYTRADHPDIVVESRIDVKGLPPGEENLDVRHLLDFRAEKRISLGGERFLGVIADIRNLLNDSSVNFMEDVRVGSSRIRSSRESGICPDLAARDTPAVLRAGKGAERKGADKNPKPRSRVAAEPGPSAEPSSRTRPCGSGETDRRLSSG